LHPSYRAAQHPGSRAAQQTACCLRPLSRGSSVLSVKCAAYLSAGLAAVYHLVSNSPLHDVNCLLGRLLFLLRAKHCLFKSLQPRLPLTFGVRVRLWEWFASTHQPSFCDPDRASCNCRSPYQVVTYPLEEN